MKRQHPSEFIYHPPHNVPTLIPFLPESGHINNVCAKARIPEKVADTEIPEIHNQWGFLWKAFPSISSNQLPSCLRSGYIIICSFALKKKMLLALDLRPQCSSDLAIHWHRELQKSGPSSKTALCFPHPHPKSLSPYILLPEFSAPLHTLQCVFHAATQQSRINALWHPIRENAS